jgi:hypothetical protein
MDVRGLVFIAVAAFVAWGLIRIGIRIGGSKASRYIVKGFIWTVGSNSEGIKEVNLRLKEHRPWYSIRGNGEPNYIWEMRSSAIGEALAKVGLAAGAEMQSNGMRPKPDES